MAILPPLLQTSAFRTSTDSRINTQQSNIRTAVNNLVELETQLASGFRVNRPSDDPLAASRALDFRREIEQGDQYLRNISIARGELETTEDALAALSDILLRAREIYLSSQNSVTAQARSNAALEVSRLVDEAVSIVNRKYQGRYLFGGRDGGQPPALRVGRFIDFVGAEEAPEVAIALGESIERGITGGDSFGSISQEVTARVDLDPVLTADTKLSQLREGQGVQKGSIRIADGFGLVREFDLSDAETVGDILDRINADGIVSAAINAAGDGIELTLAGGDISVTEVNGGMTATQLGLAQTGAGAALTGGDVDPAITLTTPLADLRGGAGLDPAGLTIENAGTSLAVSFAGAQTVEDVLNAINHSGMHVTARINDAGTGIDLQSSLSGSRLDIGENGGATAAQMGLLITFDQTEVGRLNQGLGLQTEIGDDFEIIQKDGNRFTVDVSGADTVQDILDAINNAAGNPGTLVASVPAGQTRLELVDSSVGTGDLTVSPQNGSLASQMLGILQTVPGPVNPNTPVTLAGGDLDPAGHRVNSLFDTLLLLQDSLSREDSSYLDFLGRELTDLEDRLIDARGDVGVRVQRLQFTENRLEDQNVRLQTLMSEEREVDLAETVVEFERNRALLEATYAATSQIINLSLMDFL